MRQSRARVCIGQRAAADAAAKAKVIKLIGPCRQAILDVAQTFAEGQLRERHGQKLVPAGECANLVIPAVAFDAPAKLLRMDRLDDLRKNGFPCEHRGRIAIRPPSRSHASSCASLCR
jgi:hypothetical protein